MLHKIAVVLMEDVALFDLVLEVTGVHLVVAVGLLDVAPPAQDVEARIEVRSKDGLRLFGDRVTHHLRARAERLGRIGRQTGVLRR